MRGAFDFCFSGLATVENQGQVHPSSVIGKNTQCHLLGVTTSRFAQIRKPLIWLSGRPQRGKAFRTNAYTPFSNAFRPSLATAPKISQRPAPANLLPSFANRLPIVCQRPSQSLAHRLPTVCPTPLSFQIFPPKFSIYFFIFTLAFLFCHGIMQLGLLRRRNRHQNILERELFTMKKLYKKTTLNVSTPPRQDFTLVSYC